MEPSPLTACMLPEHAEPVRVTQTRSLDPLNYVTVSLDLRFPNVVTE